MQSISLWIKKKRKQKHKIVRKASYFSHFSIIIINVICSNDRFSEFVILTWQLKISAHLFKSYLYTVFFFILISCLSHTALDKAVFFVLVYYNKIESNFLLFCYFWFLFFVSWFIRCRNPSEKTLSSNFCCRTTFC